MPAGAPRTYNRKEVLRQLINNMGNGTPLRAVLKSLGGPNESELYQWVNPAFNPNSSEAEELGKMLSHAQELWCLSQLQTIVEIADDTSQDQQPYNIVRTTKNGATIEEKGTKSDNTAVNRARLRTDVRWRAMSKLLPKLFGDKVMNEVSGPGGQPIVVNVVAKVAAHAITEHSLVQQKIKTSEVTPASYEAIDHTSSIQLEQPNTVTIMPIESETGNE